MKLEEMSDAKMNYLVSKDDTDLKSQEFCWIVDEIETFEHFNVDENCNTAIFAPKKRTRNPEQWVQNKRKNEKDKGQSYRTAKGKVIEAKKLKPPCGTKCRLKCTEKVSDKQRVNIFQQFWKMGNLVEQRAFVHKCLTVVRPKYTLHTEDSKRSLNNAFHFQVDCKQIRVCKEYFESTLDIGNSFIRTVLRKAKTGGTFEEKRGKHTNRGSKIP